MSDLYPQDAYRIAQQMRNDKQSDDDIHATLTNQGLTAYQIQALMNDLSKASPRRRGFLQRPDMQEILLYLAGGSALLIVGIALTWASYSAAVNNEETSFRVWWWVIVAGAFVLLLGIGKFTSNRE